MNVTLLSCSKSERAVSAVARREAREAVIGHGIFLSLVQRTQLFYSFDIPEASATGTVAACSCCFRATTSAIPGHSNQMFVMASG